MQHLDNDMDDLFQRAAENYPLRIDDGDWESVARKIADTSRPSNIAAGPKKKGNGKIVALGFLLLILSFGWYVFQKPSGQINRKNSSGLTKNEDMLRSKSGMKIYNPAVKTARQQSDILTQNRITDKRGLPSSPVAENETVNKGTKEVFAFTTKSTNEDSPEQHMPVTTGNDNGKYYTYFLSTEDFSKYENQKLIESSGNSLEKTSVPFKNYIPLSKDGQVIEKNPGTSIKKNTATPDRKHGAYFGLIAGPDLSKVHSGPFKSGFDVGVLFGYKINPKVSFETGLIKGRKNYSSDGSSFNMGKIRQSMPAGMTINDLTSQSNLIEIPLKVKYSFTAKKNSRFFVAGGLSSYIMTKENNFYNASVNGNAEKLKGVYNKDNYRFPADATISAGYEHEISRYLDFKIEPFLKIPLQGIGVGSLPLTSAGLHIGITRRLK